MSTLSRQTAPWSIRAMVGALPAAGLGVVILSFVGSTSGFFGWIVVPLVIVSIGGACGGVAFAVTDPLRRVGGWRRTAANALSGMLYLLIVFAALLAALAVAR